jgi:hypothetical protein
MNWEAIGAIGEILGASVVFITLAYLAIQVRYAKLAAADTNRLARAKGVTDMQLAMISNPAGHAAFMKANKTYGYFEKLAEEFEISFEDAQQTDTMCVYWFWLHWGQFRSQNSPEDIEELAQTVGRFYQLPAILYCWNNSPFGKALLEEKFGAFVDESLAAELAKGAHYNN